MLSPLGNLIYRLQTNGPMSNLTAQEDPDLPNAHLPHLDGEADDAGVPTPDGQWMRQVEQVVRQEIGNMQFSAADIATAMNLSYRQFARKLKQYTGMSPLYYQREIKLQVAREMLDTSTKPISAVAKKVGFKKASHLSALLKERFGKIPHRE
jgi:transcriptional regulator GlxA family with amidase domain